VELENPGVIPSIPAEIKTPAWITTAKYRRESFISAGIKTPALFTTAQPRRDSLHTDHDGPAGLKAIPTGMLAESRQFYVHREPASRYV
jgi:hypothetical protein